MSDVEKSRIKEIITIRFLEEELRAKGVFPKREDLNFIDIFSPKLLALLGVDKCLDIYNNMPVVNAFLQRGLSADDYNTLETKFENGIQKYAKDNLLENLRDIDEVINKTFDSYIAKVRSYLLKNNKVLELRTLNESVQTIYNSSLVYKSCSEYENELTENKNNVK